ncbi:glycosyl hydrolase family protein [Thiospirochaeta perfilievii]|uniref:Glycosyl hydrolase family protein n=1 Tax=Thiospirochaeta perfilievii TaxID=252967 RepID=A0A5C1Q8N3_9SPIO|nr:family 16 glycosylhydrolase [Thiospirochaeta perfilievii]QEN04415.1 glycosyl hydrolase family protein [Thiospirochaeta perfilievii]
MKKYSLFIGFICVTGLFLGCVSDSKSVVIDRSEFDWQLVWSDEFNSKTIDGSKWNFILGGGGYGNNELQYYSDSEDNARIEKGKLVIEAHKEDYEGNSYTSAKLTTQNKGDWTYGRYEIRAKLPEGQGIWPAFWMMPTDYSIYGPWPACGEIDIMEVLGHEPNKTHGTLHYGNPHKYTGDSYTLEKGSFSDSYHIFALEWLPGEIRWYVDGKLFQVQNDWYSTQDSLNGELTFPAPFDRDFYLQLNLAVGGNWPGSPDETTKFPQKMLIDWIRVYQPSKPYPRMKPKKDRPTQAEVPGRDPDKEGNFTLNSGFDDGLDHWEFGNFESGSGSVAVENGEVHVKIKSAGGQKWANQLTQGGMNLKQGIEYNISFKARAAKSRKIMLKIGGLEARGWAAYSKEIDVDLFEEMREYNYNFIMKEKSDPKARYEFNMGLSDIDIWIDDVKLTQIGGELASTTKREKPSRTPLFNGNLIYNGTFDRGDNRQAFWKLDLDSSSDVMINISPDIYQREAKIVTLDTSGTSNGIIFYQDNIDLIGNETYEMKFQSYSLSNRQLAVALLSNSGDIIYGPNFVDLSKDKKEFSVLFNIIEDHNRVRVAFIPSLGDSSANVMLDDVSFIKLKKPVVVSKYSKIEAEDFFSKSDTPQTQDCSEGTLNIGWMTDGDWLKYRLDVEKAGLYKIRYRVASEKSNIPLKAETVLGFDKQDFKGSGDWQSWKTIEGEITLPKGISDLKLSGVDININWIELEIVN